MSPLGPHPSSPNAFVPPLKKRRKTVSFSTDENDSKPLLPAPSPTQPGSEALPTADKPLDSPIALTPPPSCRPAHSIQLLPFASKPGEGNALIVPPPSRNQDPEESKKTPLAPSPKSPGKRVTSKDSPRPTAAPVMVCRTVQNLPLDHASMCRMAFEEAPAAAPGNKRSRGRTRTPSVCHAVREDEEDEEDGEQRLRIREQVGASSLLQLAGADLSVLADVALKMDPEAGDSEETETSDEAEEQKMEGDPFSLESLALVMSPGGVVVLLEHNYCKPPALTAATVASGARKPAARQDASVLVSADLNSISGVLEAPEEIIGEAVPPRGDKGEYFSPVGDLGDSDDNRQMAPVSPSPKRKNYVGKGLEVDQDKSEKRKRKDKENLEPHRTKKQKEPLGKKQRKRKLEVGGVNTFWD